MIPGGYILKPRAIMESSLMRKPPHIRETWDLILILAAHSDKICCGRKIRRGQIILSYQDIIEKLSWYVGYRKEYYSRHQIQTTMKTLTKAGMITTTKTRHGVLITVLNYSKYQNPRNYENHNENHNVNHNENYNENQTHQLYKEERRKNKKPPPPFETIITDLNGRARTRFKSNSKKTRILIRARFDEGFTVDDFLRVHQIKCSEWKNNPEFSKYLRPETLYGLKFEAYLNQKEVFENDNDYPIPETKFAPAEWDVHSNRG